jgi:hypothetical protein
VERQRETATEIVEALRGGASVGRAFEILRPLARLGPPTLSPRRGHHSNLLSMFANMALHRLIHATEPEALAWFEDAARPHAMRLHRPGIETEE